MMGEIYSRASQVIVWLGDEGKHTKAAFDHFHEWDDFLQVERLQDPVDPTLFLEKKYPYPEISVVCGLLEIFSKRKWWTRMWTLQEILLAEEVTVLCGSSEVKWETFTKIAKVWISSTSPQIVGALAHMAGPYGGNNSPWPINQILLRLDIVGAASFRAFFRQSGRPRFFEWIHAIARRACLDSRDKVFGLLGLSPRDLNIKPDYSWFKDVVYLNVY